VHLTKLVVLKYQPSFPYCHPEGATLTHQTIANSFKWLQYRKKICWQIFHPFGCVKVSIAFDKKSQYIARSLDWSDSSNSDSLQKIESVGSVPDCLVTWSPSYQFDMCFQFLVSYHLDFMERANLRYFIVLQTFPTARELNDILSSFQWMKLVNSVLA